MKTTKQIVFYLRDCIRKCDYRESRAKWQHTQHQLRGRKRGLQTALRVVEAYRREKECGNEHL